VSLIRGPIVILSHFQTPAPNKAFQPFLSGEAHEMVGVLDDNLGSALGPAALGHHLTQTSI
jgi:hypothetical protein